MLHNYRPWLRTISYRDARPYPYRVSSRSLFIAQFDRFERKKILLRGRIHITKTEKSYESTNIKIKLMLWDVIYPVRNKGQTVFSFDFVPFQFLEQVLGVYTVKKWEEWSGVVGISNLWILNKLYGFMNQKDYPG